MSKSKTKPQKSSKQATQETKHKPHSWKDHLRIFLTGMGMGTADLVPGVSGGTIAFIFGIYEELVQSIKTVTGKTIALVLKFRIQEAIRSVPFSFLVPLAAGLFAAILLLARFFDWALAEHEIFVWSFFFGLVLASVFIVGARVKSWDTTDVIAFVACAILAYIVVGAVPVETPENLIWFFASGAIAITAMILPGISGSFLLLIMGKYEQVLSAVVEFDFVTIGVFMAGAVIGLGLFSRVLSWLFTHHHDIVVAGLTGFMLGSLRKLWPWKETLITTTDRHGEVVPLVEQNIPPVVNGMFFTAVALMIAGVVLMILLERLQAAKQHVDDIDDTTFEKERAAAIKHDDHNPIP